MTKKKNNTLSWVVGIVIFLTVLFQIPLFSTIRIIIYFLWAIVAYYITVKTKMRISLSKEAKKYLICYFLYSIFFLIISLMDSERQLSNYLGTMAIPALMIVISDQSKQINLNYKHVYIAFIISSIIYAIWCNLSFFTSYELWSSSSTYTFSQKNSVGQILGFAFLAIIYFSKHINNKIKILAYIVAIYLLLIIAICRCRTALIGIAIATTAYIISKAKHKTITIITLIITTAIILSVPATSIFIDKVL